MQWINVSYATYFNRRRQRNGHLFQGRFKAILIDADAYLKHLSRYIHLNPVRVKMVDTPAEYTWSSYPAFVGKQKILNSLQTDQLLSVFGNNKKTAIKNYKNSVEGVNINTIDNPGKKITAGFILGDTDFVNWVKDAFLHGMEDDKEIPQLMKLKPKISPDVIVQAVSKEFACSMEQIITRGRKNKKAREVAIYLARDLSGFSGKDLGIYFGGVSGALITMMYNRSIKEKTLNRRIETKIESVRTLILNM